MGEFAPFEDKPEVAVAVSGGADSMALAHLAADWARALRGRAIALTVDHGLRAESAAEARRVGRWMRRADIEHHVLVWHGAKPTTAIQETARRARYALLAAWCRKRGLLHLLLAHHRDDQAETLVLRAARGSGPFGLAGMSAVVETPDLRLLRPLLTLPKARLRAFLEERDLPWLEDPSNLDPSFARARVRRELPALRRLGVTPEGLVVMAARHGRARREVEEGAAHLLAGAAVLHPAGHAVVVRTAFAEAPATVAGLALARLLACVGGRPYLPRTERLARLLREMREGRFEAGRTLAGCRVIPQAERVLVCREPTRASGRTPVVRGETVTWDGRFRITVRWTGRRPPAPLTVARLGREGWSEAVRALPGIGETRIPLPARPALPALWDGKGLLAAPHLGYLRSWPKTGRIDIISRFFPPSPAAGALFTVAKSAVDTI